MTVLAVAAGMPAAWGGRHVSQHLCLCLELWPHACLLLPTPLRQFGEQMAQWAASKLPPVSKAPAGGSPSAQLPLQRALLGSSSSSSPHRAVAAAAASSGSLRGAAQAGGPQEAVRRHVAAVVRDIHAWLAGRQQAAATGFVTSDGSGGGGGPPAPAREPHRWLLAAGSESVGGGGGGSAAMPPGTFSAAAVSAVAPAGGSASAAAALHRPPASQGGSDSALVPVELPTLYVIDTHLVSICGSGLAWGPMPARGLGFGCLLPPCQFAAAHSEHDATELW